MRSPSSSSTSRRCGVRLDPRQVMERTAPDRGSVRPGRVRPRLARDSRQRPPCPGSRRLATVGPRTGRPGSVRRVSFRPLPPHGAALLAFGAGDWGLLDDEASVGDDDHESRVVEVARPPSVKPRADRLEQLSAQPYDVCSRTQRDPIKIDRCDCRALFLLVWRCCMSMESTDLSDSGPFGPALIPYPGGRTTVSENGLRTPPFPGIASSKAWASTKELVRRSIQSPFRRLRYPHPARRRHGGSPPRNRGARLAYRVQGRYRRCRVSAPGVLREPPYDERSPCVELHGQTATRTSST